MLTVRDHTSGREFVSCWLRRRMLTHISQHSLTTDPTPARLSTHRNAVTTLPFLLCKTFLAPSALLPSDWPVGELCVGFSRSAALLSTSLERISLTPMRSTRCHLMPTKSSLLEKLTGGGGVTLRGCGRP